MTLQDKWRKHLTENNMTYWQHLKFASYAATRCLWHSLRLVVHAALPCFNTTALKDMHTLTSTLRAESYLKNIFDRYRVSGDVDLDAVSKTFADYYVKEMPSNEHTCCGQSDKRSCKIS